MNGPLDNQPRDRKNTYRVWDIKFVALPILIAVALIGMAITHPHAIQMDIRCGSGRVRRHRSGAGRLAPPTRVAQPKNEVRTVKAY